MSQVTVGIAGLLIALAGGIWAAMAVGDFWAKDEAPVTAQEVRTKELLKVVIAVTLMFAGVTLAISHFNKSNGA